MLLYEPYHHAFQQHFAFDSEVKEEDYISSITDFSYESMPFGIDMFSTERQENKHDMIRSTSQGSLQQMHPEAAPSLLYAASAPSIPSASSSTVGSPYLSHTLPVPAPSMYENYMSGPAILCDDTIFGYDASHFDHEATIGQDAKLATSFVGKSADLTVFAQRSSTMHVQKCLPIEPLVSSPSPIDVPSEVVFTMPERKLDVASQDARASEIQDRTLFKPPTIPASAYPKVTSPRTRRTMFPMQPEPALISYNLCCSPSLSSCPNTPVLDYDSQYNFFSHLVGNFLPPTDASCPSSSILSTPTS